MNNMISLFDEFVMKAIVMTENILVEDFKDNNKLEFFTENRERLMGIMDQISQQIDWSSVNGDTRQELNRKIEYIKTLDVKLLTNLQTYQIELKNSIEQTFKQKEYIKGYNLNDVK